jgi:hypothetical protein
MSMSAVVWRRIPSVRALDVAARPAASAVLEDENLTRLILGSVDEVWEWQSWQDYHDEFAGGGRALVQATATCKRWHKMDLNSVWKQLVLARWPAAAKLNVQDFKRFYRSHHMSLVVNQGGSMPEINAAPGQDPADIQFIVDMGLSLDSGRRSILSVVLDGSEAHGLDQALFDDDAPHRVSDEGLGWTVHPNVDEVRATVLATRQAEAAEAIGKPNDALKLYKKVHLARVANENPDMETKEILKLVKAQYAALADGTKAVYLSKETAEKERYERDVAAAKAAVAASNFPLRDAFRQAFTTSSSHFLTLTAFRKSDQTTCVLVDNVENGKMHSGYQLEREVNRTAIEEHAVLLPGLRNYKCTSTFGYLFSTDGHEDAEPTWEFGFDIHEADDESGRLTETQLWKALTLLQWK